MSELVLVYGSQERASMWEAVINELYDLSPWERWMAYNKVPWKVVFHVLVLVFSTASVVLSCDAWNDYMIATSQNICHFFFPEPCQSSVCDALWTGPVDDCLLYTMNDTHDAVYNATLQYYSVNTTSLAAYSYTMNSVGSIVAPELHVCYQSTPTVVSPFQCYTYNITPEYLGPLDTDRSFFKMLDHMTLSFKLVDKFKGDIYRGRYTWNIRIRYDLHNRGNIIVSSKSTITTDSTDFNEYFWLYSIILIVAVIYAGMVIKDLVVAYRILKFARNLFERVKEHYAIPESSLALSQPSVVERTFKTEQTHFRIPSGSPPPMSPTRTVSARSKLRAPFDLYGEEIDVDIPEWDRLSFRTCLCFFDSWAPFHVLGSMITATTASIRLQQTHRFEGVPTDTRNMLEGVGCAILWINLLGYMRHSSRLYVLVLILYGSFTRVFRVIVSSSPMFIGMALLGMSLFGCYDAGFGTFRNTFSTLFSVMNCDTIKDTVLAADGVIPVGGNVFILFFFVVFNYVILRLLICVVESILCYIHIYSLARRKRMHWRKDRAHLLGLAAYNQPQTNRNISVLSRAVHADLKDEDEREKAMAVAQEILFYELLDLCQRVDEEEHTTHVEDFLALDGHGPNLSCLHALYDRNSTTADERDRLVSLLSQDEQRTHMYAHARTKSI